MFRKLAKVENSNSLSVFLRRRRFRVFLEFLAIFSGKIKILDVGGTENFWEKMKFANKENIKITLLNTKKVKVKNSNFSSLSGDASDLSRFKDGEFDIVFSNSTIEHLFNLENQEKMAREVQRVGRSYYVQTPNKFFPIEPHFLFPFFQFLPFKVRVWLQMRFNLGWRKKQPNKSKAEKSVGEIRLLASREMKKLFPGSIMWKEKFFFLTKSLTVYKKLNKK